MTTTDGSRSISSYIACLIASRNVTCVGAPFAIESPLPFALPTFVAGAVDVFAMVYLRPFFAAAFAAGFLPFLAAGFGADLATDLAAIGAATFAIFFNTGAAFLTAAS